MKMTGLFLSLSFLVSAALASESKPILLWPGVPPGDHESYPPEADTTTPKDDLVAGRRLIRLGNVSQPTITLYPADAAKNTGAAVMVCPGGGYNILSFEVEGTEICEWLNSIGVNAILLKYRVPTRAMARYAAPLQDAQRGIGLIRSHAAEWGIDPHRVGIMGFSAGGNCAAMESNTSAKRTYPKVDEADKLSCRPDFSILIYPAYLTDKEHNDVLVPELHVSGTTPPTFLVMTEDDGVRVENAVHYYLALKNAGVPVEMHLYPKGGHGYGLRRTGETVATWPDRAADWMGANGWLKPVTGSK